LSLRYALTTAVKDATSPSVTVLLKIAASRGADVDPDGHPQILITQR
jgi:hypothetical protein